VVLAWIWLEVVLCESGEGGEAGDGAAATDAALGRRAAQRFFYAHELPKIDAWLAVVASRDDTTRTMRNAWF
jgi:butyryl-CoA dehydrogenase